MPASEVLVPAIQNLTLTLADTQYSITIPAGCKHFSFQCRTAFAIRFAFVTGKVAGPTAPYATLKSGMAYSPPEKLCIDASAVTLYFATSEAGVVVEFVSWS